MTTPTPDASLPQTPRSDVAAEMFLSALAAHAKGVIYTEDLLVQFQQWLITVRSLERDLATLKAERDEAREKLHKALATLKRIGCNQSRYCGSEAMNMFNELSK